ncbi:MAG: hypothetical protein ACJ8H8_27620 [Geminicoccaceae bacterium]
MTTEAEIETASGVMVPASAVETAAELARIVREATRDLPFGAEPPAFLVALESLADRTEDPA